MHQTIVHLQLNAHYDDYQKFQLDNLSQIMAAKVIRDKIVLFLACDISVKQKENYSFQCVATGSKTFMPGFKYLDTVILNNFPFHIYYKKDVVVGVADETQPND